MWMRSWGACAARVHHHGFTFGKLHIAQHKRVLVTDIAPIYPTEYPLPGLRSRVSINQRINSQSQALGIERPKVRNLHSVRNLTTVIYLIINARALQRAKSINTGLLQMN